MQDALVYRVPNASGPTAPRAWRTFIVSQAIGSRAPAYSGAISEHHRPGVRGTSFAGQAAVGVALAGLVACTAQVAVGAAARPSWLVPASAAGFPSWISGPLHALGADTLSQGRFGSLMAAMFACYLLALGLARSTSLLVLGATVVALHVLMALSPPLNLTDLFNYLGFARLGTLHHLNPYSHGVILAPSDPVVPFDSWRYLHSPYGPLFTLLSYAVAPLGLAVGLWILKISAAAASLGAIVLLAWCVRRQGRDPRSAVALMGLNPLVLIFGVGGGHNEFFEVLLLMAGIALTLSAREGAGALATVAAAGVKATAAIVLPFQLLGARRRRRSLIAAGAGAAIGGAVSLAIFHSSLLGGLQAQSQCISKLSAPDTLGRLAGLGGAVSAVHVAMLVILGAVFAWQIRKVRPGHWITPAGWTMLALLAALTWLMPWYVVFLLPLAALGDSRRLKVATLAACLYSLLVWTAPFNTAISDALPAAKPHLAGGCTRDGSHVEKRHPGWAQGYL